jgi:hypothetical protein
MGQSGRAGFLFLSDFQVVIAALPWTHPENIGSELIFLSGTGV